MAGIEGPISTVYPPEDNLKLFKRLAESSLQTLLESIFGSGVSAEARYRS